jgi:hypothetical protein
MVQSRKRDQRSQPPQQQWKKLLQRAVLGVALVIGSVAGLTGTASANHHKGTFPNQGLLWTSGYEAYSGIVFISSNHCNPSENNTWTVVQNSTKGQSSMSRWSSGLLMQADRCDGVYDNWDDMQIVYKDQSYFRQSDGSYIGGRNVDTLAPSSYCAFFSKPYPCGMRPQVQINTNKFFANSATYQVRELLHETGHGNGLSHHCTSDSIMNDGSSACNGGKFTSLSPLAYWATDRAGISATYP